MIKNFNRDIMEWRQFPAYDMIWTDPPWGQRMVKTFETMMRKQTGETAEHSIEEIISQLARLADTSKPVVIEYAVKDYDLVIEIMKQFGHTHIGTYERMQSMGRPFVVLVFNEHVNIAKQKGFDIITETLSKHPAQVIFDPFAGMGLSAKAVIKAGKTYVGSEINRNRFQKLITVNK